MSVTAAGQYRPRPMLGPDSRASAWFTRSVRPLLQPEGIAHWLSSADPASDLPDRIREVLVRPRP